MSIKEFFENKKALSSKDLTNTSIGIEGEEYVESVSIDRNRFIPPIDYSKPENFARYGLAEKYYDDSFSWILRSYPFDGSRNEKQKWENSASYIDVYVLNNEYPKTTGYANLKYDGSSTAVYDGTTFTTPDNSSYIYVQGVMNTGSAAWKGNSMQSLKTGFSGSNVYDESDDRTSNIRLNFVSGSTIELWAKRSDDDYGSVLADIWNNVADTEDQWGRVTLEMTGSASGSSQIVLTARSGSSGITRESIGSFTGSSDWQHYAVSIRNNLTASHLEAELYVNGTLNESKLYTSSSLGQITGALDLSIGSFLTYPTGALGTLSAADGAFTGSIDEFRFWRKRRTAEGVGRFWFTSVDGGSNTDDARTDLGLYYKFNEGITQTSSIDQVVIDYSGRTTDASFVNYGTLGTRNSGSAMVSSSIGEEPEDPVLWPIHPEVITTRATLKQKGLAHDLNSNTALFYSYPSWVIDEDGEDGELKRISQILGSYLDKIHLQIQHVPKIKSKEYITGSNRPLPFANRLIDNYGLETTEIFENIDELAQLYHRDEDEEFEKKLFEVKNYIYTNIYNNIDSISKSKGTERALKNLLHCYGIDEDLISIKYYADKETLEARENFSISYTDKKFADFNDVDRFWGTVYGQTSSANPEGVSYVYGSRGLEQEVNFPMTMEVEAFFPLKTEPGEVLFSSSNFPYLTSSVAGLHTAITSSTETTWESGSVADLQIYAVRDELYSPNVSFILTSSGDGVVLPKLTSSLIEEVYDNQKWNFGVRVKPGKSGAGLASGSGDGDYDVEFYGVSTIYDTVLNEFHATGTISNSDGKNFLSSPKRLYAGAYLTNFTGSSVHGSDVKIGSVRYWLNDVSNDEIKAHARDAESFGLEDSFNGSFLNQSSVDFKKIKDIDTLSLHWNFSTVTSSDAGGEFLVNDVSSGSSEVVNRYNIVGDIIGNQHTAVGYNWPINNNQVVDKIYLPIGKNQSVENIGSGDMINIRPSDRVRLTQDTRPIKYVMTFEKSLYQAISDEMLNWFSTVSDFSNLVGEPINTYQQEYKALRYLTNLFYEKVDGAPDVERYVEMYKWVDASLSHFIKQLIPASANAGDGVQNVIENHVLERNKYWNKFPTLEYKLNDINFQIKGYNYFKYDWGSGHAPISGDQRDNCLWWNLKAERSGTQITSGVTEVDENRAAYLSASTSQRETKNGTPFEFSAGLVESNRSYRKFNFESYKNVGRDYLLGANDWRRVGIYDGTTVSGQPKWSNVKVCDDDPALVPKTKKKYFGFYRNETGIAEEQGIEINEFMPFTMVSSSVSGGYQGSSGMQNFANSTDFVNYHQDTYGNFNQEPAQGPFTENMVGGSSYRKTPLNDGNDSIYNREEGWYLNLTPTVAYVDSPLSTDSQFLSDYLTLPKTRVYSDFAAKRPVNIKNKLITTSSAIGNFRNYYEYVNGFNNDIWFRRNSDSLGSIVPEIATLSSSIDFVLHTQSGSDAAPKIQFMSPGASGSTSPGYFDPQTGQYCVYSIINYRNLETVKIINSGSEKHLDLTELLGS